MLASAVYEVVDRGLDLFGFFGASGFERIGIFEGIHGVGRLDVRVAEVDSTREGFVVDLEEIFIGAFFEAPEATLLHLDDKLRVVQTIFGRFDGLGKEIKSAIFIVDIEFDIFHLGAPEVAHDELGEIAEIELAEIGAVDEVWEENPFFVLAKTEQIDRFGES